MLANDYRKYVAYICMGVEEYTAHNMQLFLST